jgi:deoxyguanosine kinase
MDYICIEGNIGAGKTTIAKMLSTDWGAELVLEAFEDNPFLPIFYQDQNRYAFPVELHFLMERHRQLKALLSNPNIFSSKIVADYCPQKSLIFARQTLEDREFRLFKGLFQELLDHIQKPDLIIYINRPKEWLSQSITRRGRAYELDIKMDYLMKVQQSYHSTLLTITDTPILWLEAEHIDFVANPNKMNELKTLITEYPYGSGLHYHRL